MSPQKAASANNAFTRKNMAEKPRNVSTMQHLFGEEGMFGRQARDLQRTVDVKRAELKRLEEQIDSRAPEATAKAIQARKKEVDEVENNIDAILQQVERYREVGKLVVDSSLDIRKMALDYRIKINKVIKSMYTGDTAETNIDLQDIHASKQITDEALNMTARHFNAAQLLRTELRDLRSQKQQVELDLSELEMKYDKVRGEKEQSATIETLKAQKRISDLQDKLAEQKGSKKNMKKSLHRSESALSKANDKIKILQEEAENTEKDLHAERLSHSATKQELASLKAKWDQAEFETSVKSALTSNTDNAQILAAIERLEEEFKLATSLAESLEAERESHGRTQQKLEEEREAASKFKNERDTANAKYDVIQQTLEHERGQKAKAEKTSKKVRGEKDTLTGRVHELEKEAAVMDQDKIQLKKTAARHKKCWLQAKQEVEKAATIKEQLETNLESLEKAEIDLRRANSDINDQLTASRVKIGDLQNTLSATNDLVNEKEALLQSMLDNKSPEGKDIGRMGRVMQKNKRPQESLESEFNKRRRDEHYSVLSLDDINNSAGLPSDPRSRSLDRSDEALGISLRSRQLTAPSLQRGPSFPTTTATPSHNTDRNIQVTNLDQVTDHDSTHPHPSHHSRPPSPSHQSPAVGDNAEDLSGLH